MYNIYEGLKVIELADEKGMYCGKILASLGADVLKIEKPGGDPSREMGPFAKNEKHPEKSLSFAYFNTGKRDITLDITNPDGKKIFKKLISNCDVLIETFEPGFMAESGLGSEDLKSINPGLIMLSITSFGQTGPYKNWKAATDLIVDAMGGPMSEVGTIGKPPLHFGCNIMASAAGMYGLFALQAAYHNRFFTGEGTFIDVSEQECFTAWRSQALGVAQVTGENPRRSETASVRQGFVNCKDGFAYLMIGGKWKELMEWFRDSGQDTSVFDGPSYLPHTYEVLTPWDSVLLKHMNQLGSHYTKEEFMLESQRRKIPAGTVDTPDTLLKNVQFLKRDYFVEIEHPIIGRYSYPGAPAKMTGCSYSPDNPAPLLGADNRKVYSDLGYSSEDINKFSRMGVI